MTGGLFDPLGTGRAEPSHREARFSAPAVALGVMLAALGVLLAVSWLRDSGDRGMPVAVGPIEHQPPAPAKPAPAAEPPPAQPQPPAPPSIGPPAAPSAGLPPRDDQDVQIENGVRVVRPRRVAPAPPPVQGGQMLRVPDPRPAR